jgi:hypothetical protein
LRGADIDLAASPPIIEDMLFHCQQAAEKAMKGFLTAHDRVLNAANLFKAFNAFWERPDLFT